MPITVTAPQPGGALGPGMFISGQTDFIGPFPSDSHWHLELFGGTTNETPIIGWDLPLSAQDQHFFQMIIGHEANMIQGLQSYTAPGSNIRLVVQLAQGLFEPILEETSVSVVWDPVGLAWTIPAQVTTTGGFTQTDRDLLTAAERRTRTVGEPTDLVVQAASGPQIFTLANLFSRQLLDRLTLEELTSGETGEPVRASLGLWFFGVIVRVTTISEDLVPKTPDEQWYFPDLAVLRIFRGVDLEYRRGIHTPTFMQENPWQWGWGFLNESQLLGVPPETTVAVDWRVGCAGQVFVQRLP